MRMTSSRQMCLEPMAIFGCIRTAARFTKRGRASLQTTVAATLDVDDHVVLVNRWAPKKLDTLSRDPQQELYIDVRTVVNPVTKGRNIRYRVAASPGWNAKFRIGWDDTMVSENEMRSILNDAGQFVGVGDGRVIGFGRFLVAGFDLEGKDAEKQAPRRAVGRKKIPDLEA